MLSLVLLLETTIIVAAGYGSYCYDGNGATKYDEAEWSEEPYCEQSSVQSTAEYFTREPNYELEFQTVNLSAPEYASKFCCNSNYTTLIPSNTSVEELDTRARQYYEAAERVLSRFNCRDFYPYFSCAPCQYAYRSWVCSVMFPRKCADILSQNVFGHTQKVCKDVCYEVVRKCPVELEFHCPTDDTYGDWGFAGDWSEPIMGAFRGRCNPMELNIDGSSSVIASFVVLLVPVVVALLF
eukprot:TRINITY_DN17135_c0_g1_i1.p1 TRINITY_DN17135_c0_g1~~TRINITY_DN17135_c0_g1_i1.p1  ORF type:complete len:239 (+),score=37.46 TRINITY_DN17135_c0_g1_i1:33-749(+)